MNVRAAQLPTVPAQPGVTHQRLDVTVSDGGVQQRPQAASVAAASAPGPAVASAVIETDGLGGHDLRGRTPKMPVEAQSGRLLDITG